MKKALYFFFVAVAGLCGGCSNAASHAPEEEGHEHGESEEIELSDAQIKAVDIQTGEIALVSLGITLKANGELAVNPQDEALIAPLTAGLVKRIAVKEGEKVAKGRVVAYVENLEAVSLQQDYLIAKEEEAFARQELERQQALAKEGAGVKKNLQQATANAQMATTKVAMLSRQLSLYGINSSEVHGGRFVTEVPVVSPIAGTVTEVMCSTGSFADSQAPLMKVVNNAAVYCKLNIFEKSLSDIGPGQKVEVRLTNRPTVTLDGEVVSLTQAIKADTKSLTAHVKILNGHSHDLVPGMAVTGVITSENSEVEALPDDAIVTAEGKSYVFIVEGQEEEDGEMMTHFKRIEIIPGIKGRGYTQVKFLSPVDGGTKFVTKNAFYLGSMTSEHGEHNH